MFFCGFFVLCWLGGVCGVDCVMCFGCVYCWYGVEQVVGGWVVDVECFVVCCVLLFVVDVCLLVEQ